VRQVQYQSDKQRRRCHSSTGEEEWMEHSGCRKRRWHSSGTDLRRRCDGDVGDQTEGMVSSLSSALTVHIQLHCRGERGRERRAGGGGKRREKAGLGEQALLTEICCWVLGFSKCDRERKEKIKSE
jgi:hypothetical protein